jgi:hypothetical protein
LNLFRFGSTAESFREGRIVDDKMRKVEKYKRRESRIGGGGKGVRLERGNEIKEKEEDYERENNNE